LLALWSAAQIAVQQGETRAISDSSMSSLYVSRVSFGLALTKCLGLAAKKELNDLPKNTKAEAGDKGA
jgi:hypothetical protein